jgi:hypothetical protein
MPGHRLHIQQIPLITRAPLHSETFPAPEDQQAEPRGLFSGLLGQVLVPTRPARQLAKELRVVVRTDEARTQLRRSRLATGGVPPNEHTEDHSKQ